MDAGNVPKPEVPLRWGIAGCSRIGHDFCIAVRSKLTGTQHEVVAIASRFKDKANKFARENRIARAYCTYEELAEDANVDVVYIATLNTLHYDVARIMILHGKHIVVGKPLAMNFDQAKHIFDLAGEHRVFIVEGMWSRFFPVYRQIARSNCSKRFGDIMKIVIKHGFVAIGTPRIERLDMGGGITLDIGGYAIQLVLLIFAEAPHTIRAKGKINCNGVDLHVEIDLTFSKNRVANITCSGLETLENSATLISSKGPVVIPDFWCPTRYVAFEKLHRWEFSEITQPMYFKNSLGLKYQADEVALCIREGLLTSKTLSPEDSLLIANIQDEVRKQIGVVYEADKTHRY